MSEDAIIELILKSLGIDIKGLSRNTNGNLQEILTLLPPQISVLAQTLTTLGNVIAEMNKIGQESIDTFKKVNNALSVTGESDVGVNRVAMMQSTADSNWKQIKRDLDSLFTPVTMILSSINSGLSEIILKVTDFVSYSSDDVKSDYTGWYVDKMAGQGDLNATDINTILSEYMIAFKNQGATDMTAANMAVKLHNMVVNSEAYKTNTSEEERNNLFNSFLDAVISGETLSQYGINTSDNVLTGYLSEQGIDNVNVKLSESMESFYRLNLIETELGVNSDDILSRMIQNWGKLGDEINHAQGSLLAFDEANILSGYNSEMPDVGMPEVYTLSGEAFGGLDLQYTQEELEETQEKLLEYLDTLDLTPEEKQTLLTLFDEEAELVLATYLFEAGKVPEDIITTLACYNATPDTLPKLLEDLGLARDEAEKLINTLEQLEQHGTISMNTGGSLNYTVGDSLGKSSNSLSNKLKDAWNTDMKNIAESPLLSSLSGFLESGGLHGAVASNVYRKHIQENNDPSIFDKIIGSIAYSAIPNTASIQDVYGKSAPSNTTYEVTVDMKDATLIVDKDERMDELAEALRGKIAQADQRDGGLR